MRSAQEMYIPKRQLQKRPTKETYKVSFVGLFCRFLLTSVKWDLRKRCIYLHENYKRDLQKRPTEETPWLSEPVCRCRFFLIRYRSLSKVSFVGLFCRSRLTCLVSFDIFVQPQAGWGHQVHLGTARLGHWNSRRASSPTDRAVEAQSWCVTCLTLTYFFLFSMFDSDAFLSFFLSFLGMLSIYDGFLRMEILGLPLALLIESWKQVRDMTVCLWCIILSFFLWYLMYL